LTRLLCLLKKTNTVGYLHESRRTVRDADARFPGSLHFDSPCAWRRQTFPQKVFRDHEALFLKKTSFFSCFLYSFFSRDHPDWPVRLFPQSRERPLCHAVFGVLSAKNFPSSCKPSPLPVKTSLRVPHKRVAGSVLPLIMHDLPRQQPREDGSQHRATASLSLLSSTREGKGSSRIPFPASISSFPPPLWRSTRLPSQTCPMIKRRLCLSSFPRR